MDTRLATCPLAMTKKPSKRRLPHPAPQKKKHKKPPKKPRPDMSTRPPQKSERPSSDDDDDDDDDDDGVTPAPPAPPAAPPAPPVAPPVAPAAAPVAPGAVVALEDPKLLSRLLYPNPVCLLSVAPRPRGDADVAVDDATADADGATPEDGGHRPNVMTISWLAPINNDAAFVCSINLRRFTLRMLRSNGGRFCLSVPAKGFEKTVLAIGACSGWRNDKPAKLGFELCSPGWGSKDGGDDETARRAAHPPGNPFAALDEDESETGDANDDDGTSTARARTSAADASSSETSAPFVAVRECIAHLQCEVTSMEEREGHAITFARVLRAHVRASHWSGKTLAPQSPEAPPILTFLGSQKFGYVRSE